MSLIILVPVFLLASFAGASAGAQGVPLWAIFILPVIYLIVTYIAVVIVSALYNVITPMTGGIEYDANAGTA